MRLVGEIRAGSDITITLEPGQAAVITTGAPVPAGADAVQMSEHTRLSAGSMRVSILQSVAPGDNIVPRGAEAKAGEVVLRAGRVLGPAEIGVLATFGFARVPVYRQPRVGLLVTGDELVESWETPRRAEIRNSNAYSLRAQLACLGIEPEYLGIARDDPAELRRKISEGLEREILIISGGASVGPYDLVKSVFEDLGIKIIFSRVALRPGKPTVFARKGDTLVFGLPGNPVSSFVSFESFVRPALGRLCGLEKPELPRITGQLARTLKQTRGRTSCLPAVVVAEGSGWKIHPLPWKGSGDIIGFSQCNALVIFPGDRDLMTQGELADAVLLPDFFLRSG